MQHISICAYVKIGKGEYNGLHKRDADRDAAETDGRGDDEPTVVDCPSAAADGTITLHHKAPDGNPSGRCVLFGRKNLDNMG